MANNIKTVDKNTSYNKNGFKHIYVPMKLWELLDNLSKTTGDTKIYIIQEALLQYSASLIGKNSAGKVLIDLVKEVNERLIEFDTTLKSCKVNFDTLGGRGEDDE